MGGYIYFSSPFSDSSRMVGHLQLPSSSSCPDLSALSSRFDFRVLAMPKGPEVLLAAVRFEEFSDSICQQPS
jgi:hypothetical protein